MTGHRQGEDCSVTRTLPIASPSGQHTGCFGVGTQVQVQALGFICDPPPETTPLGEGEGMESCPSH